MQNYYDTSFLDYYAYREPYAELERNFRIEGLLIDSGVAEGDLDIYDLIEMVATYTDEKGRDHYNINKVPLFMDDDDIYYLRQFPPEYWREALSKRYNNLLVTQHFRTNRKNPMSDWMWVGCTGRFGKVKFFIDTGITKLYEKLTRPKDIDKLRRMTKEQRKEYEEGGGGFWHHTFDNPQSLHPQRAFDELNRRKGGASTKFSKTGRRIKKGGPKDPNKLWVTDDYVGVGEGTTRERLHHWLEGIREQWVGKPQDPEDAELAKAQFGSGEKQEQLVGSEKWVKEWVTTWQAKMKEALKAYRPVLPQIIIDKLPVDMEGNKVIWNAWSPSMAKVIVTCKSRVPYLLPAKAIDRKDVKRHNEYRNAHNQVKEAIENKDGDNGKLIELINKMRSSELPKYIEDEKHNLRDEFGKLSPEALESRLDSLAINEAILAVKYWIKEHGIDIDNISSDRVLHNEELRGKLLEKLSEFLEHAQQRMSHIKAHATRYDVWDWVLGDHNDMRDENNEKKYKRLYSTVTFGGLFPNRQQKTKTIGDPDDWKRVFNYYFGEARTINKKPYVLRYNIPNLDEVESLPMESFDKEGAIWSGINYALNGRIIRKHVPEWQALSNRKQDLSQVINAWMMWQTGEAAFKNFMDAFNKEDTDLMEKTGKLLFQRIRNLSKNFVISVFQLDIEGRGTVRTRSGRGKNQQLSVVQEYGDLIQTEKKTIEEMAKDMSLQNLARAMRSESSGKTGVVGHSIRALKARIKAIKTAHEESDFESYLEKFTSNMAKDVLVNTMINIYIAKMSEAGKKINRDYKYEDAEKYAHQVLGTEELPTQENTEGSYESRKIEFFREMQGIVSKWIENQSDPKEMKEDISDEGRIALNIIYNIIKLNDIGKDKQASNDLNSLENSLSDPEKLVQQAHGVNLDPEKIRMVYEFVLYHFGRGDAPAAAKEPQTIQQPAQGFTLQQESTLLQAYMRELFGGQDPAPTGPIQVPESTINLIMHGERGTQIYQNLKNYSRTTAGDSPYIICGHGKSINLTHHPRFIEWAKAVVDAVDAHARQNKVNVGGRPDASDDVGIGF